MKKEIIGYKLIKPEYEEAAVQLINSDRGFSSCAKTFEQLDPLANKKIDFNKRSYSTEVFEKAGVLDLWFTPVYKEEPELEVGKWFKWEGCNPIIGVLKEANKIDVNIDCYAFDYTVKGKCVNNYDSLHQSNLIPATDKEVEEALIKEFKKRYLGKQFNNVDGDCVNIFDGNRSFNTIRFVKERNSLYVSQSGVGGQDVFKDGVWAEIISQPETYTIDIPKELKNKVKINWK